MLWSDLQPKKLLFGKTTLKSLFGEITCDILQLFRGGSELSFKVWPRLGGCRWAGVFHLKVISRVSSSLTKHFFMDSYSLHRILPSSCFTLCQQSGIMTLITSVKLNWIRSFTIGVLTLSQPFHFPCALSLWYTNILTNWRIKTRFSLPLASYLHFHL